MPISNAFVLTDQLKLTFTWGRQVHDAARMSVDDVALTLADRIMAIRCAGCLPYLESWRERVAGGDIHPASVKTALEAFVAPVFGLPASPPRPRDHIEGFVAQHLWYELTSEDAANQGIVFVEKPGFVATAPGGDAIVVFRDAQAALHFRLWELKKCTGTSSVSGTVSTAYQQLASNAPRYLAQYTAIGQKLGDGELAAFFGTIIDQWLDDAPTASAGIAVHTSEPKLPKSCFSTFAKYFPGLTIPVRLRGLLVAVADFPRFTDLVKAAVWSGL